MTRRIWLGALSLLGVLGTNVVAQPLVWKRVQRPSDPKPIIRASSGSTTGVLLDRPISRDDGRSASGAPRPFPQAYRYDATASRLPTIGQADRIPVIASPGSVIAVSMPPSLAAPNPIPIGSTEQEDTYHTGEQFAADRNGRQPYPGMQLAQVGGPMVPGPMASEPILPTGSVETLPPGNWTKTYPVNPPPQMPAVGGEGVPEVDGGAPTRFYARAEYLLWWMKNDRTPPLITTGSVTDQAGNRIDGAIGNPDTVVLFGGTISRNPFSGARFTAGYALDDCGNKFVELSGFFLGQKSRDFTASSAQYPLLTRPFFAVNPNINQELVQVSTRPGSLVGSVSVHAPSQLWGIQPNLICNVCQDCNYQFGYLVGARYLNLRESITIVENLQGLGPPNNVFPSAPVLVTDQFATTNQFFGGQVGVQGFYRLSDRFSLGGQAKLALGVTHQTSNISGSFVFPGNTDPKPGGLLAGASNIGQTSRDRFAVVPEVGLRLGYDLTDCIQLTVGYNFLYWSSVMRPGDQIDRNLDVTRIPNFVPIPPGTPAVSPAKPMVLNKDTDFFVQGLTVGLAFRY